MATSFSNPRIGLGDNTSQGQPHNKPSAPLGVDTSSYREGYAGQSAAFSFYNVSEARHVDARPLNDNRRGRTYRAQLRPIEWDEYLGASAAMEFERNNDPAAITWKAVVPHVALMYERLTFQKVHYKCKGPSPEKMVFDCLARGPAFTSEWASAWKESRFRWCNVERVQPDLEKKREIEFDDYNSTYPPFFMIFWKDQVDDYRYMNMGEPSCDQETLDHLQSVVADISEQLLPHGLPEISMEDEYMPVSSGGYLGDGETKPEWEIEFDYPWTDETASTLSYMRGQAMKRPSEVRDIGLHTPASMRLHRRIMYPMKQACRKIPNCPYGKGQDEARRIVTSLGEKFRYFYMRDYTKSGMTMPRQVRAAIIRGFYSRRPDLAEKYVRAFDQQVLFFKEEDHVRGIRPDTGTPLGMFVEGFTLFGYAVDTMVQQSLQSKVAFSCVNDDMIAASRTQEGIRAYADQDITIQEDLGMLVKGSKSGLSTDRFFFCEEYWDGDSLLSKEVLTTLTLIGARYAINVVHAKELTNSILLSLPNFSSTVRMALKMVQESYDPEFSDQETNWPYLFGGWLPCYQDGLDCSIKWRNGDGIADIAYWASQQNISHKRELGHDPAMAYSRLKDLQLLEIPEDEVFYNKLVPLFGKKKALQQLFSLLSRNPRDLRRHYDALYWKRHNYFHAAIKGQLEIPSVTRGWLRRHPNSVIIRGLEGVVYRKPDCWANHPRVGLAPQIRDWELRVLSHRGLVSYPGAAKVSRSMMKLANVGYVREIEYSRVGVPKGGCSRFVLQNHLAGLEEFETDHDLTIALVDEDDVQEPMTEHWCEMILPLQWLVRVDVTSRGTPYPLSEQTRLFWQKLVSDKWQLHGWDPDEPTHDAKSNYVGSSFEEDFIEYIRSLLDGDTAEIRAQLIPKALIEYTAGVFQSSLEAQGPPPEGYYWSNQGELLPINPDDAVDFWDKSSDDSEVAADWDF